MQQTSADLEEADYVPSEDEPFMSERQLNFFKKKLLDWKEDILRKPAKPSLICRKKLKTTLILPIARHPRLTGR